MNRTIVQLQMASRTQEVGLVIYLISSSCRWAENKNLSSIGTDRSNSQQFAPCCDMTVCIGPRSHFLHHLHLVEKAARGTNELVDYCTQHWVPADDDAHYSIRSDTLRLPPFSPPLPVFPTSFPLIPNIRLGRSIRAGFAVYISYQVCTFLFLNTMAGRDDEIFRE